MKNKLRVVDFFCGAGGFSEGFRQQGYDIIYGIDNWRFAVEAFNINHGSKGKLIDVLEFEKSLDKIKTIPNSEVVIGSPPCVSFSLSNNSGKANKELGIRLIETYLRVVAVKKHQRGSILKVWLMENVPNSRNYIKKKYTFKDLGLGEWSKSIGRKPNEIALRTDGLILTASDYGSPQRRKRFVCGELTKDGKFPVPDRTIIGKVVTLGNIKNKMPAPSKKVKSNFIRDPNYPFLKIKMNELSDHFYDTGIYEIEWKTAKLKKENHPFMGKMSFPENLDNPSRTIMATRSAGTREAIIYNSEVKRKNNGKYRLPTIREVATLMGFPYTYQFKGSEGVKWRLIGNAVCPHMSFALAKKIKEELGHRVISFTDISFEKQKLDYKKTNNLNDGFKLKDFKNPPKFKSDTPFRRHPVKAGNITVNLTNFNPTNKKNNMSSRMLFGSIFYGTGRDYRIEVITPETIDKSEHILQDLRMHAFIFKFNNWLTESLKYRGTEDMEEYRNYLNYVIDWVTEQITKEEKARMLILSEGLIDKKSIHVSQVMSIYAIGKISYYLKNLYVRT